MLRSLIDSLPADFRDKHRTTWQGAKTTSAIVAGKLVRLLHRPKAPTNADGSVNLHLGCGSVDHPAFINVDGIPAPHVHHVRAIDDLSPFDDASIDLVYASHCLEHFSHRVIVTILREWRRVLRPAGTLRLSVPDFDLLLGIYRDNARDVRAIVEPLMGGQDYRFNFHHSIFTRDSLSSNLREAGFTEIREWRPNSSPLTSFDDWSCRNVDVHGKSYPVSLNLEAVR